MAISADLGSSSNYSEEIHCGPWLQVFLNINVTLGE